MPKSIVQNICLWKLVEKVRVMDSEGNFTVANMPRKNVVPRLCTSFLPTQRPRVDIGNTVEPLVEEFNQKLNHAENMAS